MSTINDHSEQNGSLPTFTSINKQSHRPVSYADSSHASSSRSVIDQIRSRSQHSSEQGDRSRSSPVIQDEESAHKDKRLSNVNGSTKRMKRASGGFLLESSPTSSRLSRSILSKQVIKGKQKRDSQTLSVTKRRPQVDGQDSRSSIGASPLSSEIKSSPPLNGRSSPSQDIQNISPSRPYNGSTRSHGSASSRQPASSYGFDTDPAQIVEMALRLNEGRRRQASGKRYVSSGTDGKRVISTATSVPPKSSSSVRKPIGPEPVTPQKRHRDFDAEIIEASPLQDWLPEQDVNSPEDSMQISRATQNRVNKAKTYFELAYEHRRLVSHLPPTRPPGVSFDPEKPGYDSRAYNPLQYVRNRKLRFRERAALDTASEGWHDVLKVRAWVDAVINSHSGTKHDPLECLRLPPLSLLERETSEVDGDPNAAVKPTAKTTKARRPKSDWVTHPGDMIADAFWTEQGLNKQKIYNRDNELIYPPGTKFMFSGWRNRTPLEVPQDLRSSSPESSPATDRKQSLPALPDLPKFESAHKDHSWARTRSKFSKALNRRSRTSKDKEHEIFDTSSDSSDSNDDTEPGKEPRGRKRLTKHQEKLHLLDGDPFALPTQSMDIAERNRSSGVESSIHGSQRDSWDHAALNKRLRRDSTSMSATKGESDRQILAKRRGFLNSIKLDSDYERGRSSFEYDSTAPSTPAAYGFPSIAINLSPPHSRSPSPTKKPKGSFLDVVKDKIQPQKERVDRTDFARDQSLGKHSRERSSLSHHKRMSYDVSRGTSPMSRGISPFAAAQARLSLDEAPPYSAEPRSSTISKVSSRTTDSGTHRSHRVRGMFKGGRIAELVGNEVSRVGEFIWKREPPRRSDITETGSTSGYESDSDELTDGKSKLKRAPTHLNESLPSSSPPSLKNVKATSPVNKLAPKESPQFHIQGLPSFTSPFQRDRDETEKKTRAQSPGGTPQIDSREDGYDDDPISTAAKARRAAGRSPRFDNLAPPKLDIRAATPDGRRSSYGFGETLDLTRTRSASYMFNNAINGEPLGQQFSAADRRSTALSQIQSTDLTKVASNESGMGKPITVQDCFRTRSLLLTIAVKATNVADYADGIPEQQSSFLYSAFDSTGASGSEINRYLPARRREEHVIAARHLISRLNDQSADFNDRLNQFTTYTTPNLQREIQILEDKADKTLFPRLESLSDSAGQLAERLTTTSALAIKSVNDEVAEARRLKRRGPGVIGRWFGYKLMEWGVVSMLWAIWFVVTICRFGIGTVRFIWGVIAWLFWLR